MHHDTTIICTICNCHKINIICSCHTRYYCSKKCKYNDLFLKFHFVYCWMHKKIEYV